MVAEAPRLADAVACLHLISQAAQRALEWRPVVIRSKVMNLWVGAFTVQRVVSAWRSMRRLGTGILRF